MFLLQREALFRRFFELAKFPFVSHIGYPLLQLLINMSEAVEPAVPDEEVLLEVFHHPLNLTFCSGPAWTASPLPSYITGADTNSSARFFATVNPSGLGMILM